jgi:Cysteine rich repeat
MMIRILVLTAVLTAAASAAFAQSGTPHEEAACRPDVRRFCHAVAGSGNGPVLACLQEHRQKLRKACREVLESHGQ